MAIDARIRELCKQLKVTILERLSGNVSNSVFRVSCLDGSTKILKIAVPEDAPGLAELRENRFGYSRIREMGISSISPIIYETSLSTSRVSYILLEDLGPDFRHATRLSDDATYMYQLVFSEMLDVYRQTLRPSNVGAKTLVWTAELAQSTYLQHLTKEYPDKEVPVKLERLLKIAKQTKIPLSCFASFDFTPENVHITVEGIRYTDPHAKVEGCPIIDIACFAGVARDAYHLPGSFLGYEDLYTYATTELASLLQISSKDAKNIFWIGRVLQCFLSARFRLEKRSSQSRHLYLKGIEFLAKVSD